MSGRAPVLAVVGFARVQRVTVGAILGAYVILLCKQAAGARQHDQAQHKAGHDAEFQREMGRRNHRMFLADFIPTRYYTFREPTKNQIHSFY
jgi:hypothetical protein